MEDMMTHARQEGNVLINGLEFGWDLKKMRANGTNMWDINMEPGNDLLGNISWSLWQTTSNNYLRYGQKFDPELKQLYKDYIVKYGLSVPEDKANELDISRATGSYRKKMKEKLGEQKANELLDLELKTLKRILSSKPQLHVMVTASLIQDNYDVYGVRSPNAIRSYYWLEHQKGLKPAAWLGTVHANDINVRGDYGKQIVLGNSSNDRGMVFWYAATGDQAAIRSLISLWDKDAGRLGKKDYDTLKTKGYLTYIKGQPGLFEQIRALLP
jgi:hypothetical protein